MPGYTMFSAHGAATPTAILGDLTSTYGFYDVESDVNGHFVWAKGQFGLRGNASGRFYAARICYYGDAGTLQLRVATGWTCEVQLQKGWHTYALDLGAGTSPSGLTGPRLTHSSRS
jgi:hypothetical protein